MRSRGFGGKWCVGIVFALSLVVSLPRSDAATPVRSSQVINAIKRGVVFLLNNENPKNTWDQNDWKNYAVPLDSPLAKMGLSLKGGQAALVTEALIDVNQSLHLRSLNLYGPKMRLAIHYLEGVKPTSTYAASFQANVFALLPNKAKYRRVLNLDRRYLLDTVHRDGGYIYYAPVRYRAFNTATHRWSIQFAFPNVPGKWDNSNTQYGVLGIWACAHAGLEIPFRYWQLESRHWRISQHINGTWGYAGFVGRPTKPSAGRATQFTPAGLASLFICDEFIDARNTSIQPVKDPSIVAGLHWMNHNFNPNETNMYAMYGDERVGLASGIKTFGDHDWYRDFAATLLKHQNKDGSWGAVLLGWNGGSEAPLIGTAYTLLILDRGLNPVFMNKLRYGLSGAAHFYGQWNARQRDLANVTSWISRTYEVPLNWQVVNIHTPVTDWLDSPILYINGYKDPKFTKSQVAKIRAFVDAGGMVFCNCNGSSHRFEQAMIQYGQRVVNHQYEARQLPRSSLLYHMLPGYKFAQDPGLLAISNGIRNVWIVSLRDLGATWQKRAFSRREDWNIPASLYLYATGKGYLANKLKSLNVPPPTAAVVRSLAMSQVIYKGNWNPEPGAWPRMAKLAATDFQTRLNVSNTAIDKLNAKTTPLAHITGTDKFVFSAAQITALKTYIAQGGMIFADAGGGKSAFTDSFDVLAQKLVPKGQFVDLPANASICKGSIPGGINATKVRYRKFYVDSHRNRTTPALQGIKVKGRWVIVFSPWDITSGLLGTNTWGINGYTPASAQALARNVICYAIAH